jgi:hypothetical protein
VAEISRIKKTNPECWQTKFAHVRNTRDNEKELINIHKRIFTTATINTAAHTICALSTKIKARLL